jgi:hypothetical protein
MVINIGGRGGGAAVNVFVKYRIPMWRWCTFQFNDDNLGISGAWNVKLGMELEYTLPALCTVGNCEQTVTNMAAVRHCSVVSGRFNNRIRNACSGERFFTRSQ